MPAEAYHVDPVARRSTSSSSRIATIIENRSTSTVHGRQLRHQLHRPFPRASLALWVWPIGGANEAVLVVEEIGTAVNILKYIAKRWRQGRPLPSHNFTLGVQELRSAWRRSSSRPASAGLPRRSSCCSELALRLEEIALGDPYFVESEAHQQGKKERGTSTGHHLPPSAYRSM